MAPSSDSSAAPSAEPSAPPVDPGGLRVEHFWIDQEDEAGGISSLGDLDDARIGLTRFVVYRVRFQVLNDGDTAAQIKPMLYAGAGKAPTTWTLVPGPDMEPGLPFYAASDNGATWSVRSRAIPIDALRLASSSDPDAVAVDGVFSGGKNPGPTLALPADSFTEIEFAVRATVDAAWQSAYAFRLSLDGPVLTRIDAPVSLGAAPGGQPQPGQQRGVAVGASDAGYRSAAHRLGVSPSATAGFRPPERRRGSPRPHRYTTPYVQYTLTDDAARPATSRTAPPIGSS